MYAAAQMQITGIPVYPSCKGCRDPLMQSAAFHRIFMKLPFQLDLLKRRANRYTQELEVAPFV
jgi:hypothetical protein